MLDRAKCGRAMWGKRARSAVGFGAVTVALFTGTIGAARAENPAMYRFDAAHAGVIGGVNPGAYGGYLWRIQTGGTVRSTPAEADGIAYIGAGDGILRAIRVASGDLVWQKDLGCPITSSPAVTDQLAIIVAQDGRTLGIERTGGQVKWTHKSGPDAPAWQGINGDYWTSSATLAGGKAFVGEGNGDVVALDTESGRELWKFHASTRFHTTPAVANGAVYIGGFNGVFYALDASDGHPLWTYRTLGADLDSGKFGFDRQTIQSSAAVRDGRVLFGARDGLLYCLDAKTGKLDWKFDHVMSWVNTSPAVTADAVYAGSSDKRFLQALDVATGKELWRVPTGLMWTAPAVAGETVYTTDGDGQFSAFERETGKKRWSVGSAGQIWTSPFLSGDHAIFGCDNGGIYCFRVDAPNPLMRAVYWDDAEQGHTLSKFPAIRDALKARGYEVLDNVKLAQFLKDRADDRKPSTVVMSMGFFPKDASFALARRYMSSGGKIVWCGILPDMWPVDKTGQVDMADIDWKATRNLMDVQPKTIFDNLGTTPTAEGSKWGLRGMWLSDFAADPSTVTTVLAKDERGLAEVWLKSFGGRPGSGFVRICGMNLPSGPTFMDMLASVAETFPKAKS